MNISMDVDLDIDEPESRPIADDSVIDALSALGEHLIRSIMDGRPLEEIVAIIEADAPLWYQNEEGMSALHAAAYQQNPELASVLIQKGAIWNAVDNLKHTAGDIALSFNDEETYTVIRDAGIRTGMIMSLLSGATPNDASALVLQDEDQSAMGSTDAFLKSNLRFMKDPLGQDICMLQSGDEEVGVMMGWERGIMEKTVEKLCTDHPKATNLKILNVGFGLGLIDSLFQSLANPPSLHAIIEPHPDVLRYMKENGWDKKPGVQIFEGKWQDVIEDEAFQNLGAYDVIYTDTFSEDYNQLHEFFELVPNLISGPESRFSFFNGLGATNPLFYDVYTHIAELHLTEVGMNITWSDVDVRFDASEDRWGNSRNYFSLPIYRLPLGNMNIY